MTTINATLQDPNFGGTIDSVLIDQLVADGQATFDELFAILDSDAISITSASPTRITFAGGGVSGSMDGSFDLFDGVPLIVTRFSMSFPGGSMSFTGSLDLNSSSATFTSLSINTAAFRYSFTGNLSIDDFGFMSGSFSKVTVGIGTFNVTLEGNLIAESDGSLGGSVSVVRFSDVSGTNSIVLNVGGVTPDALDAMLAGATDLQSLLDSFDYTTNDNITLDFTFGANFNALGGNDTLNGGRGNDNLQGGDGNDTVRGLAGNDTLEGGAGNDVLEGGLGNDSYVADPADTIVEAGGIDEIRSASSFTLPAGPIENLLLLAGATNGTGNESANKVTGNDAANLLLGLGGADVLVGGGGNDTTEGGAGNDTHVVGDAGDVPVETEDGGIDTVQSTVDWTLQANFENLTLLGVAHLRATGNELPNIITGNAGDNTLDGGGGADTLLGGGGNDTYVFTPGDSFVDSGGTDGVLAQASVFSPLAGIENATLGAGAGNGWVAGGALNNTFTGNAGGNLLDGGAGDDTLVGGRGDDTLLGGTGNDRLDGGRGVDVMEGGMGNDVYVASGVRDQILELAAGGNDTVEIEAARFTLPDGVENALLARDDGAIVTGNALANRFIFDDTAGVDLILNFTAGADKIVLDDDAFSGLAGTPAGTPLAAGAFVAGAGAVATQADDRVLYDTASGALYFDADGAGGGAAVQFATLGSGAAHPTIVAADFLVI